MLLSNISSLSSANKSCLPGLNTALHTLLYTPHLLVVKDDVGQPDDLGGDVDLPDPPVLAGVPPELVVVPLLHKTRIKLCQEGGSFIKRHYSHVIRILSYIIH